MKLNGKQKRYLRAMANTLKAVCHVGKEGISDALIDSIDQALEAFELVKVHCLKTIPTDMDELTFDIAMHTHSEVVQRIGKTIVLYRPSKEKIITLP